MSKNSSVDLIKLAAIGYLTVPVVVPVLGLPAYVLGEATSYLTYEFHDQDIGKAVNISDDRLSLKFYAAGKKPSAEGYSAFLNDLIDQKETSVNVTTSKTGMGEVTTVQAYFHDGQNDYVAQFNTNNHLQSPLAQDILHYLKTTLNEDELHLTFDQSALDISEDGKISVHISEMGITCEGHKDISIQAYNGAFDHTSYKKIPMTCSYGELGPQV